MNIIAARNIREDEVNTDKNIRGCVVYTESQCILLYVLNTIYTTYILYTGRREGRGGFQNSQQLFPVSVALSVKRH